MQKSNVERRRRMGFIKQILERNKMAEMNQLVGQLMMNFGVSKRDAREEIEGVCQAMGFIRSGNLIKVHDEKETVPAREIETGKREV